MDFSASSAERLLHFFEEITRIPRPSGHEEKLRDFLKNDPDTLLYECKQFDETALALARQWTEEYLHD